ncbi:MAG TPA: DUF1707 domain-containing protein [Candidatus Nanopelagicales bacterium]
MASQSIWDAFALDPRSAQYGGLRASDADREVVHGALSSAYADGRLTREEFDQRSEAVLRARTLSELPVLIHDLVPDPGPPERLPATAGDGAGLEARAVAAYERDRREAAWGFVSASLACWVIWWVTSGGGGFPWPVFVMLGTGLHLLRLLVMRDNEVQERRKRLERKAGTAVTDQRRRELEPGSDDES